MNEQTFPTTADPVTQTPEINLSFDDNEILDLIDRKINEYDAYFKSKDVDTRSKKNVKYYVGDQGDGISKIVGAKEYINNVIYRDLNTRAQNATSKMPDIVVISPQQADDDMVRQGTKKLEEYLKIRLDSDVTKRLAKSAIKDNALKFRGFWKYRYDFFKKDVVIDRPRPQDIILDATARIPEDGFTADNMEFIAEWIEEPTATVMAKFPSKAKELEDEIRVDMSRTGKKQFPSKIKYLEVWATMHDSKGNPREILAHRYNNILLYKGKNPYWDEDSENLDPNVLRLLNQIPGLSSMSKSKNFFPFARKPYTIWSGDNLGDGPLDDTTVVEVSLPMQDIVNIRGNQITQINNWAIPKFVTSTKYMDEEKAANITRDASEIIVLSEEVEDVRSALLTVAGEPASPALYSDLQQAEQTIDKTFATNAIQQLSGESGESKKIVRQQDLDTADDIAQVMVQRGVEEAASWIVQLAKIFFEDEVSAATPGKDSEVTATSISSAMIPDDIQIVIRANTVDKATKKDQAVQLAGMKAIDPYSLFDDLDYPNPKEMAKRLVDFLNGPPSGYVNYMQDIGVNPTMPANQQTEQGSEPPPPPIQ